jgi:hypothetical protein
MWFLSFSFPNPVSVNISFTYYEKGTFKKDLSKRTQILHLESNGLRLDWPSKFKSRKWFFCNAHRKAATAWPKKVEQQRDQKMFLFKCNSMTQKCFFSSATVWPKNVSFQVQQCDQKMFLSSATVWPKMFLSRETLWPKMFLLKSNSVTQKRCLRKIKLILRYTVKINYS